MLPFCVLLCHALFVFFFFFKQKTAYELRISDWSSDVCSPDLHLAARLAERGQRPGGREHQVADAADVDHRRPVGQRVEQALELGDHEPPPPEVLPASRASAAAMACCRTVCMSGTRDASGREREWQ